MILFLVGAVIVLALALWLTTMYLWWQHETGTTAPTAATVAQTYGDRGARLIRRGWYRIRLALRSLGQWISAKTAALFFRLFPAAKPAFAKHDDLAGLTHGPTSYFLRSISEKEPAPARKATKKAFRNTSVQDPRIA